MSSLEKCAKMEIQRMGALRVGKIQHHQNQLVLFPFFHHLKNSSRIYFVSSHQEKLTSAIHCISFKTSPDTKSDQLTQPQSNHPPLSPATPSTPVSLATGSRSYCPEFKSRQFG